MCNFIGLRARNVHKNGQQTCLFNLTPFYSFGCMLNISFSIFSLFFWMLFYMIFLFTDTESNGWENLNKTKNVRKQRHTHCVAFALIIEPLLFLFFFFRSLNPWFFLLPTKPKWVSLFIQRRKNVNVFRLNRTIWTMLFIHGKIQRAFSVATSFTHTKNCKRFLCVCWFYIYISTDIE